MSSLRFRLCSAADKPAVTAFMDANWGSPHPLIHDEAFFAYYYADGDALRFAVAEQNGEILALAGYIPANQSEHPDIWVSLWCAKKGHNGSGLELMAELPKLTGCRVIACNNIRPKTIAFYEFLGYTGAWLPHYYRLADKPKYEVALVTRKDIWGVGEPCGLVKITDPAMLDSYTPSPDVLPAKDAWYMKRRFFAYPHQQYDVYARFLADKVVAVLATRTICVNGVNVLRIADYIGKPWQFSLLGGDIDALMKQADAEYADMYVYGISVQEMARAGFTLRRQGDDANIIPNYLTPLLRENTDYYFFTSNAENFLMCKADGDQDRPNLDAES